MLYILIVFNDKAQHLMILLIHRLTQNKHCKLKYKMSRVMICRLSPMLSQANEVLIHISS